jgi:hypothetical protein
MPSTVISVWKGSPPWSENWPWSACTPAQWTGSAGAGARIHRQIGGLGGRIDAADRGRVGIDGRDGVGRHGHFLLDVADLEAGVDPQLLAGGEHETSRRPFLESIRGNFDGVAASLGVDELVFTGGVRLGGADRAFVEVVQRDVCAGNERAGIVFDGADDAALNGLRPAAGYHKHGEENCDHDCDKSQWPRSMGRFESKVQHDSSRRK